MHLTEWIISVMEQLGYFGIALLMFLETVFPPIPSEIIIPTAGYSASQGELLFVGVVIAGSLGSLLAAALLYWVGYKFNNQSIFRFIDRYGKFMFLKSADVKKSLDWFELYGHRIVFFGRLIPAVRSLISIPAGMSHMPFRKFMFYSSLGTIIWTTFLACIGFYFGENQALMQEIFSQVGYGIIAVLVLIITWRLYLRYIRNHK